MRYTVIMFLHCVAQLMNIPIVCYIGTKYNVLLCSRFEIQRNLFLCSVENVPNNVLKHIP